MRSFVRIAAITLASAVLGACVHETKLLVGGDAHDLRKRAPGTAESSPSHPPILVIALDGVDRELLYDMIRAGELPAFSALLGPHAYFDRTIMSTLPSSTMAAWATTFTGVTPAHHGIAGNEFFIREDRRFAAPAPATFNDHAPVLQIYTDQYLNKLCLAPSVYDRMRADDPNVLVWVAMQQIYSGADKFLLTKPTILIDAFEAFVDETVSKVATQSESRSAYEKLDKQVVDVVVGALDDKLVPDVLTVYLSGTDLYAHVAKEGPDAARRAYLRDIVDGSIGTLTGKLRARGALANRWVVVTSDHGHTEVMHDGDHAMTTNIDHGPPAVLVKTGFRVRPFKLDVSKTDDFQSVIAFEGAMAFVYLADRSTCDHEKVACDWTKPPRYEEDVLAVAEAYSKNNEDGALVPALRGKLDMVLTRRPRAWAEDDLPFEVYVGHGAAMPIDTYLASHPHPTYAELATRLHDLAVGPHGERAGDVLLIAHNGDRATPAERYYFAEPYHSWHGSPSHKDSDIPLIVSHPPTSEPDIQAFVEHALGEHPRQQRITDLLLDIRHRH